jgi:hypothetical protein
MHCDTAANVAVTFSLRFPSLVTHKKRRLKPAATNLLTLTPVQNILQPDFENEDRVWFLKQNSRVMFTAAGDEGASRSGSRIACLRRPVSSKQRHAHEER